MPLSVTITSTKLTLSGTSTNIVFGGLDLISATPFGQANPALASTGAPSTNPTEWFVKLRLTGDSRIIANAEGDFLIRLLDVDNQPTWTNDVTGAQTAADDIRVMIRSVPSGGGGGQVDTIVPGDAIDVDATDPVNPIVNAKVDGVTIQVNGSNELEAVNVGTVTDVTATYPLLSSGGATPDISADTSLGGNDVTDDGKLPVFNSEGQLRGSVVNSATPAIWGSTSGLGYAGFFSGNGNVRLCTSVAAIEVNHASLVIDVTRTTAGNVVHIGGLPGTGLDIDDAGILSWTSATGPQGTATNLPVFGTATKGVVPASGGGTTNFLRADGTFAVPPGTGVTAVSVASANGFAGSSSGGATPALTLSTTVTGILIGNGTAVSAAGTTGTGDVVLEDSPALTGTPTAPTAADGTKTTQIATTAFVAARPMGMHMGSAVTWTNMPSGISFISGLNAWNVTKLMPLGSFTQARLVISTGGTGGVAGAKILVRYSPTFDLTASNYLTMGASEIECVFGTTTNSGFDSGWIDLVPGAIGDVYVTILGDDGNGTADPVIGTQVLYVR